MVSRIIGMFNNRMRIVHVESLLIKSSEPWKNKEKKQNPLNNDVIRLIFK